MEKRIIEPLFDYDILRDISLNINLPSWKTEGKNYIANDYIRKLDCRLIGYSVYPLVSICLSKENRLVFSADKFEEYKIVGSILKAYYLHKIGSGVELKFYPYLRLHGVIKRTKTYFDLSMYKMEMVLWDKRYNSHKYMTKLADRLGKTIYLRPTKEAFFYE